jgi:hypothetical protein
MPLISATQEKGIGGSWSKTGLGKGLKPYLKNKLKAEMLGAWLKWYNAFLASMRL